MDQEIVKAGENPSKPQETLSTYSKNRQKEVLFARNWVIDQNAARSYRAAGYKCSTKEVAGAGGSRLLSRVRVRRVIDNLLAARASRLEVRADKVLEELQVIAYANMQDYTQILEDGSLVVDLSKATREQMAAIQEVHIDEYVEDGDNPRRVKKTKFKLHAKFPALEKLYQHAVPRAVDNWQRDAGPGVTIVIDCPRPARPGLVIDVKPTNGNGSNGTHKP